MRFAALRVITVSLLAVCLACSSDTVSPTGPTAPAQQPASVTMTINVLNANALGSGLQHQEKPFINRELAVEDIYHFAPPPNVGGIPTEVIYTVTRNNGNTFDRTFIQNDFSLPGFREVVNGDGSVDQFWPRSITYETRAYCGTPCDVSSVSVNAHIQDNIGTPLDVSADAVVSPSDVFVIDAVSCKRDSNTACLLAGRFKVGVGWRTTSLSGTGTVVNTKPAMGVVDFSLDGPAGSFDLFVQVQDQCSTTNTFSVSYTGTTNAEFTIEITDTDTGVGRQYFQPLGDPSQLFDPVAFRTCVWPPEG